MAGSFEDERIAGIILTDVEKETIRSLSPGEPKPVAKKKRITDGPIYNPKFLEETYKNTATASLQEDALKLENKMLRRLLVFALLKADSTLFINDALMSIMDIDNESMPALATFTDSLNRRSVISALTTGVTPDEIAYLRSNISLESNHTPAPPSKPDSYTPSQSERERRANVRARRKKGRHDDTTTIDGDDEQGVGSWNDTPSFGPSTEDAVPTDRDTAD